MRTPRHPMQRLRNTPATSVSPMCCCCRAPRRRIERYPTLKIVLIEAGFAWLPSLGWRLDRNWKRLKAEVPHLKRAPSEYMRQHFWVSTQPMEEPEHPADLIDVMGWIGWDRILFASDYPHWDYDDPG